MKLGGSVLTDKARYRTLRDDAVARLAKELAEVEGPLVVVHGAGSFGHVLAKRHALAEGDDGSGARRAAFGRVLSDVRALGSSVSAALNDAGRPATWHGAFDLARLDRGALAAFAPAPLADALRAGFTPILSGDGALDASRGFGIVSGDVLMVELARAFRPKRAVFATDVDGIFDRDPRESGARLLERADAPVVSGPARVDDVTGGMAGKLERARAVARTGTPVLVVNGHAPGRVRDALAGARTIGTEVTA